MDGMEERCEAHRSLNGYHDKCIICYSTFILACKMAPLKCSVLANAMVLYPEICACCQSTT